MSRRHQKTVRTGGLALALGATVLLSGCATVDGRASAAGTPLTLATTTPPDPTTRSEPSTTRPTSPDTTAPIPSPDTAGEIDGTVNTGSTVETGGYTGLALGDPVVIWDDDGEADVYVRRAVGTADAGMLEVTVDYECYDGQCPFYVADWTVTDAAGKRYRPTEPSGFGDTGQQRGMLEVGQQKRGHLYFEVPAGPVTVEFDQASGDPATWLVPAA